MSGPMALAGLTIGLLNAYGQKEANDENNEYQRSFNYHQQRLAREAEDRSNALQKEFAQNGVSWRVQDAERAGIHPLYALGASGASYSPAVSIGGGAPERSGKGDFYSNLANMGQDVSRSIYATATSEKRERAMFNVNLEEGHLRNELLRHQIAQAVAQGGPGLPSNSGMPGLTGQGNWRPTGNSNGYVNEIPLVRVHSQPGRPAQEVGSIPDYSYVKTSHGYAIVPSRDVKERIEDTWVPEAMWNIRNLLKPAFKGLPPPDPNQYAPPPGYNGWKWSPLHQEFRPVYNRDGKSYKNPMWRR